MRRKKTSLGRPARGVAYSRASREELRVSKGPKAGLRILQDACVFWNMITHTHTISFRLEFDSSCRMPDASCTEPPIDGRIRQMAEGKGRPFCICTARGLPKCGRRYRDALSHGAGTPSNTHRCNMLMFDCPDTYAARFMNLAFLKGTISSCCYVWPVSCAMGLWSWFLERGAHEKFRTSQGAQIVLPCFDGKDRRFWRWIISLLLPAQWRCRLLCTTY